MNSAEEEERDYADEEVEAEVPMQAVTAVETEFGALIREDEGGPKAESRKRVHDEEITAAPSPSWLLIDNLVRPFTENALKQLLSATGNVLDCWMPKFKTHAVVQLESHAQAEATRAAVEGQKWPHGTNKTLTAKHVSEEDAGKLKAGALTSLSAKPAPRPANVAAAAAKRGGIAAAAAAAAAATTKAEERSEKKMKEAAVGQRSNIMDQIKVTERVGAPGGAVPVAPRLGIIAALKESMRRKGSSEVDRKFDRDVRGANQRGEEETLNLNLDDLFRKTIAKPSIYWMPVK